MLSYQWKILSEASPVLDLSKLLKYSGIRALMVAAMALGGGEAALDIAIAYAKERIQFKTPFV
jgi:hypothetical protein